MADEDGAPYSTYMDLKSAADYWWVQEFTVNSDAFATPSTYLYKKRNGKLCWGPLWDFDNSFPNWMETNEFESLSNTAPMKWLDRMRAHDADFQAQLRSTWRKLDEVVKGITEEGGVLDKYASEIERSWTANRILQNAAYEREDESTPEALKQTFDQAIGEMRDYLENRRAGIENAIEGNLTDVYSTVEFVVDDQVVKTAEVRRGLALDIYDLPPNPSKEGQYFLKWVCDGENPNVQTHRFNEDGIVRAVFIPDEEATRPSGLFFPFDDEWVDIETRMMSPRITITPENTVDERLTWTSSDPSVASINPSILSTHLKIRNVGETVISCTSSNGITASFTLHVYDPAQTSANEIEDFQLESDHLSLKTGGYGQVKANIPLQPTQGNLYYKSSDNNIAKPLDVTSGVIQGIAPGTCTITVHNQNGSVERQYTVTVSDEAKAPEEADNPSKTTDPTKAKNTLTVKGKTAKVKLAKLKKKGKVKLAVKKVLKISGEQGALTYAKAKGHKKIAIAGNGRITVKKGLKKGVYKVKVKVTAAGNADYKPVSKTATFKIRVR